MGAAEGLADRLTLTFRLILVTLTLLALVLTVLFGIVLLWLRPAQLAYSAASRAVQETHADMIDQETGLRGYLLIRDDSFLAPYRRGADELAHDNADVVRLAGSDAALAPALLEVRLAQQAWTDRWAADVVSGAAPTSGPELVSFLDEGKRLFDAYRQREDTLTGLVEDRREVATSRVTVAYEVGLGLVVITLSALAIGVAWQRRLLADLVVGPVEDIVAVTDLIGQGVLDKRIETSGPAEIQRIGSSVNSMAAALGVANALTSAQAELAARQQDQLRRILDMAREISGSLSLKYVLHAVAHSALNVSDFSRVIVWLSNPDGDQALTLAYDTQTPLGLPADRPSAEVGVGVVGQAVKHGRLASESDGQESIVELNSDRPLRTLAVPLVVGARVSGAIEFVSQNPISLSDGSLEVIETLAIHAAASIEAARLHGEADKLSKTDALTALPNRRSFNNDIALECERTTRYQRPMALIMFDVDHFKSYNDEFGHQRGDEALQELAAAVRRELRPTDTAYRFGGEEFVVLARETTGDEAGTLAERLRERIEHHFAAHGTLRPITASFGIGVVPPTEPHPDRVVAAADAALYRAKANGRNRIENGASSARPLDRPHT